MTNPPRDRLEARDRVAAFLSRYRAPRTQMLLLLILAGFVGFALSFVALKAGMTAMWLRYPLAGAAAYGAFLGLVRAWARRQVSGGGLAYELERTDAENEEAAAARRRASAVPKDRPGWLEALDWTPFEDFGEVVLGLAVIGIAVALVAIVVMAPVVLSEALVDSLLMAGLWRRFSGHDGTGSFSGAARATFVPAAIAIASLAILGVVLQIAFPGAYSIGDIFRADLG